MGLISKTSITKWNAKNKKWYEVKKYIYTKIGDNFEVSIEDLKHGSSAFVDIKCDGCGEILKNIKWGNYLRYVHGDNKYYCHDCALKLFGKEKRIKTLLKKGISFEQWCVENNRQDVLDRWDYDLNNYKPNEVTYSSSGNNEGYWFKCPKGIHKSELIKISSLNIRTFSFLCKQCNSFEQWCYDNLLKVEANEILSRWDYELNIDKNGNMIKPSDVISGSEGFDRKGYWFKCLKHPEHKSELKNTANFTANEIKNLNCGACNSIGQHLLDTYGENALDLYWSDKNIKTPFNISKGGDNKIYIKCQNNNSHLDYPISCANFIKNKRCPICSYSKGETRIDEWLKNNGFTKDKDYIPQKEFEGLLGLGDGNLSYDFYLPQYNLLIEYQGEFHDRVIKYKNETMEVAEKRFEKQQEHDSRKKEYADDNNIELLPIWYWDYDNIETILNKELIN